MNRSSLLGKIIAYTGAHGTGKTTAVFEKAAELKKSCPFEIGVITETARYCPLPIFSKASGSSVYAQNWIFAEQMQREIERTKEYQLTVADRTIVDVIAYTRLAGLYGLALSQIEIARPNFLFYKTVYFRSVVSNPYLIDDGFRSTDPEKQLKLENILINLYRDLEIPVVPIAS